MQWKADSAEAARAKRCSVLNHQQVVSVLDCAWSAGTHPGAIATSDVWSYLYLTSIPTEDFSPIHVVACKIVVNTHPGSKTEVGKLPNVVIPWQKKCWENATRLKGVTCALAQALASFRSRPYLMRAASQSLVALFHVVGPVSSHGFRSFSPLCGSTSPQGSMNP